jgi:exodeoxyribonuclease VII small subunit
MSTKAKPAGTELNFETAMDRLEKIVEQMESGQLPLEDLIVQYEEGMNLVKVCQERLASAEQKIEIIARNNAGKPVVKEFEPATETNRPEPRTPAGEEHQNDEVRLF